MRNPYGRLIFPITLLAGVLASCVTTPKPAIESYEISRNHLEKELRETNNGSLYHALTTRFQNLDTTLTENQLKLLYYGQLLQPEYQDAQTVDFAEIAKEIQNKKIPEAILKLDSILLKHPLNLHAHHLRSNIAGEIDPESKETKQRLTLTNSLIDAILSTGDGEDRENAIDVISIADEYFICYQILYTDDVIGQTLIHKKSRTYDKLKVVPNQNYKKKAVWFDITNIVKPK